MSKHILISLFILVSIPMVGQAQVPTNNNAQRIEAADWRTTHFGEGLVGNTEVIAAFEQASYEVGIPDYLADRMNTLVPIERKLQKYWRIILVDKNDHSLRQTFQLVPKMVYTNGKPTYAFVNQNSDASLHFLLIPLKDGTIHVSFSGSSLVDNGELLLNPALQTM